MSSLSSRLRTPAPVNDVPTVPGLPVVGNLFAFRRDRLALQDAAARLGPIARFVIGPIAIYVITGGELAHEVLVDQAANFRKSVGLQFLRPLLGNGLLTAEGEPHRQHRKLLAPAFAPRRLASYGEVMVAETREQIARWSPGDRIDLAAEMMQMTLAIAGRTLFGVDVRRDARTVSRAVELAAHAIDVATTSPLQLDYRWCPRRRRPA